MTHRLTDSGKRPVAQTDPQTQIAAGLEQLVMLTRATFSLAIGTHSHQRKSFCVKPLVRCLACRLSLHSRNGGGPNSV